MFTSEIQVNYYYSIITAHENLWMISTPSKIDSANSESQLKIDKIVYYVQGVMDL